MDKRATADELIKQAEKLEEYVEKLKKVMMPGDSYYKGESVGANNAAVQLRRRAQELLSEV